MDKNTVFHDLHSDDLFFDDCIVKGSKVLTGEFSVLAFHVEDDDSYEIRLIDNIDESEFISEYLSGRGGGKVPDEISDDVLDGLGKAFDEWARVNGVHLALFDYVSGFQVEYSTGRLDVDGSEIVYQVIDKIFGSWVYDTGSISGRFRDILDKHLKGVL